MSRSSRTVGKAGISVLVMLVVQGGGLACAETPGEKRPEYGAPDFVPSPERPIGWRGDGETGSYPGATPVVSWNETTGWNIVWRVTMPNWSNASPIVVGDRVIAMAEPHTILCYGARTGKLLWHNATDPFDLAIPDKAEAARQRRLWEQFDLYRTLRGEAHKLSPEERKHLEETVLPAMRKELDAVPEMDTYDEKDPGKNLPLRKFADIGIWYTGFGHCIGRTMTTPVSDGECVYYAWGSNCVGAYDLATGKARWFKSFGAAKGENDARTQYVPSPLLRDGVLVVQAGWYIRGLEATTGKVLWENEYINIGYATGSPVPLKIGKEQVGVVVTAHGWVIGLRDGTVLTRSIGVASNSSEPGGGTPVAYGDQVVIFAKGVTVAFRIEPDGASVKAVELWRSEVPCENAGSSCYHNGMLINPNASWDWQTGEVLSRPRVKGNYSSAIVAGNHVFQVNSYYKDKFNRVCVNTADKWRTIIATDNLYHNPSDEPPRTAAREAGIIGWIDPEPGYGWSATWSTPTVHGDRLYIRSRTHLYCIGDPLVTRLSSSQSGSASRLFPNPAVGDLSDLIQQAKSEKDDVREQATEAIGTLGMDAKAAVPALLMALNDEYDYVAQAACRSLGKMGSAAVPIIPDLLKMSGDAEVGKQRIAYTALRALGPAAAIAVPDLLELVSKNDHAEEVLVSIGPAAAEAMIRLLTESTRSDWAWKEQVSPALVALTGRIGAPAKSVVPALLGLWQKRPNDMRIVNAIRRIDPETAQTQCLPKLIATLGDPHAGNARGAICTMIPHFGAAAKDAIPALEKLASDSDTRVSGPATEAILRLCTPTR